MALASLGEAAGKSRLAAEQVSLASSEPLGRRFCPALAVRVSACAEAFPPADAPKVAEGGAEREAPAMETGSRGVPRPAVSRSARLPTLRKADGLAVTPAWQRPAGRAAGSAWGALGRGLTGFRERVLEGNVLGNTASGFGSGPAPLPTSARDVSSLGGPTWSRTALQVEMPHVENAPQLSSPP